ncbi:hypothetical protein ACHAW6_009835 [Cyclotella cf. meneghiniana]
MADATAPITNDTQSQASIEFMVPLNDEHSEPPVRRSGRYRKTNNSSLKKSFKEYLDTTPSSEIEEFSAQLETTMSALPTSLSASLTKSTGAECTPSSDLYAPARRPSRAGSELAFMMKTAAAAALLDLGDLNDDDTDDEVDGLGIGDHHEEKNSSNNTAEKKN